MTPVPGFDIAIGNSDPELTARSGWVIASPDLVSSPLSLRAPALLGWRATDLEWTAEVDLEVEFGVARFQVRIDEAHWYGLTVHPDYVEAEIRIGPAVTSLGRVERNPCARARLRIDVAHASGATLLQPPPEADLITLSFGSGQEGKYSFGPVDGRYLSTEVAGGFTGRVIDVEALRGEVALLEARYSTMTSPEERVGLDTNDRRA